MDGDKKPIILKCFKNKRKFRTYVFNAEQYFDTIEMCHKIFTKIKKALGTSMEVKSASESDESATKENNKKVTDTQESGNEDNSENEDNLSNESADNTGKSAATLNPAVVNENDSDKGQKRKKIKKKHKTQNYVSDPVFSFGGDQINKIIKFLTNGKYVTNDCIKV